MNLNRYRPEMTPEVSQGVKRWIRQAVVGSDEQAYALGDDIGGDEPRRAETPRLRRRVQRRVLAVPDPVRLSHARGLLDGGEGGGVADPARPPF